MIREFKDFETPHLIGRKAVRLCSLKRFVIVIILVVVLAAAATLSWFFLIAPLRIRLEPDSFFMLALETSESVSDANAAKEQITNAGGGGYIVNDGKFRVTAAVYKKQSEAATVEARLKESFPDIGILRLNIKKASINSVKKGDFDKELKKLLLFPSELIDFLLQKSVVLDTQQITESALLIDAQSRREALTQKIRVLESMVKDYPETEVISSLHRLYKDLDAAFNAFTGLSGEGTLSHRLKYFSCEAAYMYYSFRKAL